MNSSKDVQFLFQMRSSADFRFNMSSSWSIIHMMIPLLLFLVFHLKIVAANISSISAEQVIQVNTTEAFFLSIKTSDYFSSSSSGHGTSSNDSIGSIDGTIVSSTVEPSTVSSLHSSSSVKIIGAEVELLMSVSGRADLPDWMYYKFDKETSTGYLYGSPVTDGDIEIEIIALNSYTYDTTMDTLKLTVVERESK